LAIGLRTRDGALEIPLLVVPGSSRDRILGEHDGRLRVAVSAPPERGAANRAVAALLARTLGVRRQCIELVSGATSRRKDVRVEGLSEDDARRRLEEEIRR
jgi:uncharacterized protein (TIGR00251 family)